MNILFLTRYPYEGASSRYRVFQYIPFWEDLGVKCTVQSFMDQKMYRLSQTPKNLPRKIAATLWATIKRLKALMKWREYDLIYMQRELFPFGAPIIEKWLHNRGAILFYDYDDALFIKKASRYSPLATWMRSADKTLEIFKTVTCVVTGNNWLRDTAISEGAKLAVTVEVAEDTNRIPMRNLHNDDDAITIGWLGSPSTVKYLHFIKPALQKISANSPNVKFEIIGGDHFEMDGVDWDLFDWSLGGELEALARFDIGLMPLPMEDWAKGKSGGKARTYMAAGVVPVCAAIGYNLELIEHGKTGFLCSDSQSWEDALSHLITNHTARNIVAKSARSYVIENFSLSNKANELFQLFKQHVSEKAS